MRGVDAKDYYAAAIKSNAACNAEYSSMADELSESISSVYAKLVKIILTDSNAMKDYEKNMTSGNVEKDVEYLKELIDGFRNKAFNTSRFLMPLRRISVLPHI